MVSKEDVEPLVPHMHQFLNIDTYTESLFMNTACVCMHTCTHMLIPIYAYV